MVGVLKSDNDINFVLVEPCHEVVVTSYCVWFFCLVTAVWR